MWLFSFSTDQIATASGSWLADCTSLTFVVADKRRSLALLTGAKKVTPTSCATRCLGRSKLAQRGSPRHTWLEHHFQGQKVKEQGHQAALLTAVLARQAAAAVAWERVGRGKLLLRCNALRRPRRRRGAGHTVAAAGLQLVINIISLRGQQRKPLQTVTNSVTLNQSLYKRM